MAAWIYIQWSRMNPFLLNGNHGQAQVLLGISTEKCFLDPVEKHLTLRDNSSKHVERMPFDPHYTHTAKRIQAKCIACVRVVSMAGKKWYNGVVNIEGSCERVKAMQIRTMGFGDYDPVYALWINTPGMGINDIDDTRAGIEKYLLRNPTTCFVAEGGGGEIIGVILSGHDGRRGYIYHMAVYTPDRNHGIGTALLARAMEALKKEGITKVAMVVFSDNVTGNDFWQHRGFVPRSDLVYRNKDIVPLKKMDT